MLAARAVSISRQNSLTWRKVGLIVIALPDGYRVRWCNTAPAATNVLPLAWQPLTLVSRLVAAAIAI